MGSLLYNVRGNEILRRDLELYPADQFQLTTSR
jgi:hypothetical protein